MNRGWSRPYRPTVNHLTLAASSFDDLKILIYWRSLMLGVGGGGEGAQLNVL